MNILLDLVHPAHVHFFRHAIETLKDAGHSVAIASRNKDCTTDLLDDFNLKHTCISTQNDGRAISMAHELWHRNRRLKRIAKEHSSEVIAGVGGVSAAQTACLLRRRSVIFYDTEAARLQNALSYPFASRVVVPQCYTGWVPKRRVRRYRGYHELAYLHPNQFKPDRDIAIQNGLYEDGDTFLIRLVSWKANHDLGLSGWTRNILDAVVKRLKPLGRVLISSEQPLPDELRELEYDGCRASIHHLIGHCRLTIGESATMASESVVMGVPAVYAAPSYRGYISEQENRYQMVKYVPIPTPNTLLSAINAMLNADPDLFRANHARLLADCVDVTEMVCNSLTGIEDAA